MIGALSTVVTAGLLGGIGTREMIVIFGLFLLLFGAKRLPQLSRSIGESIRDFQKGLNSVKNDINAAGSEENEDAKPGQATATKPAEDTKPAKTS